MLPKPEQTAFLFPGQGSQVLGMGRDLAETYPTARKVFEQADEFLGYNLSGIAWDGPQQALDDTINTQPALLVHSVAVLRVFQELYPNFTPALVAGHSMGELSALVASGALPYLDALQLVLRRGELMKQAGILSPGGMAAIIGLDIPTLDELCTRASTPDEIVQVANDNCPGQVVISGANSALLRAIELAQQAGARRAMQLAVSIAAHSPLMSSAQTEFNQAVQSSPVQDPRIALVGNVTAQPLKAAEEIRADLQAQLYSRVRWTESIQRMLADGIDTFIEMGSGTVLSGLLKRIDRQANAISLGAPSDFEKLAAG